MTLVKNVLVLENNKWFNLSFFDNGAFTYDCEWRPLKGKFTLNEESSNSYAFTLFVDGGYTLQCLIDTYGNVLYTEEDAPGGVNRSQHKIKF